jgi:protein tyrosine/serine phosphatase
MTMRNGVVLAVLGLAGLGGCSPATVGKPMVGVENFATVEGGPNPIYRGGQPTREGFERLAQPDLKVATIIDLRDDPVDGVEETVKSLGMKYLRIGTNAGTVDKEKIREFLKAVATAAATGPVFIHCRQGRDRTGLEVAMYRILVQGWTRERAIAELREHGYNRFWFPGIERYVQTFDAGDFKDVVKGGGTAAAAVAAGAVPGVTVPPAGGVAAASAASAAAAKATSRPTR